MTTYGLTSAGFVPKTLSVVREEINTAMRSLFGASIDLGDESIFGQIVGIFAEREASVWAEMETVNSSQDPDKATGAGLDALATLTGTFRPSATYSVDVLTWTGTPATIVPSGTKAATLSTDIEFQSAESGTITLLSIWTNVTPFAVDDRVTNASRAYICIEAGTSAGSGGPTTTSDDITDGSVHWRYLGEGTGAVDVMSRASETGPSTANSGDITVIVTPVAGLSSVINLLDADVGSDIGTDADLRVLRELELSSAGRSTHNAIVGALLLISGVESVTLFVNPDDVIDADDMPPHSVEALVRMPAGSDMDQLVLNSLFDNVAAGIATTGTTTGTVTDSSGTDQTVSFSRPVEVPIYVIVEVDVDPNEFPDDGADQIEAAIVAWGDAQKTGKDAVASGVSAQAFSVDGVTDVTSVKIGVAPAPTLSTTIAIALRELATFDTSRITVNVTEVTP